MTLVAVLFATETPLLVSDSLVSNRSLTAAGAVSPLLPHVDQRLGGGGFRPTGLARKYWILPDKTFFFYSGDITGARNAFDRMSQRISAGEVLTRQMAVDECEAECSAKRQFSCILIGQPDSHGQCSYEPIGAVLGEDIEGYGYVLAIGSGAKPFLDLLRRSHGPADSKGWERVVAALNAAALATLEYQQPDSELSVASSGGYFEVTIPSHFVDSWAHLIRGSAHLFMDVLTDDIRVSRFAASKQSDKETITVSGHDLFEFVEGDTVRISAASLQTIRVAEMRQDSTSGPYAGVPPIAHLSTMSVYGTVHLPCGHSVHAKTVIFNPDGVVGTLLECDDVELLEGQIADLLVMFIPKPIENLCRSLRAAKCLRCKENPAEPLSSTL